MGTRPMHGEGESGQVQLPGRKRGVQCRRKEPIIPAHRYPDAMLNTRRV